MPFKTDEEDEEYGEMPLCMLVAKSPHKQEGGMKCAHLITSREMSACSALDKPYVPSLFELGEYCRKDEHRKCPFFLKSIIKHGFKR